MFGGVLWNDSTPNQYLENCDLSNNFETKN